MRPPKQSVQDIDQIFENYYEDRLKLFPLEATMQGDDRYNDLLPNSGAREHINAVREFYLNYLDQLHNLDYEELESGEQLSYSILESELKRELEEGEFHPEYTPINQMHGLPLMVGRLGSGTSSQPFKKIDAFLSHRPFHMRDILANVGRGL